MVDDVALWERFPGRARWDANDVGASEEEPATVRGWVTARGRPSGYADIRMLRRKILLSG
jgi:hypothetical protein